ncbi:MAG: geranylgeranyl reductase family protein [Methanomicrobiales archaeon]|nr:geranylgeranyl reductase family protein [Methanomicrobiales archaeon]
MIDRPDYDAIVVGGGPAGSTAACLLRKFGHRVALFERQTYPRDKICGGCLSQKSIRFLDRVFSLSVPALRQEGLIECTGTTYAIYVENTRALTGDLAEPFYFTRRERYDAYLARRAAEAGVEVHEGVEVTAVDHAHHTITTSEGDSCSAPVLIGADGIHSRVRRSFPEGIVDHEQWQENLGMALELVIPRSELQASAGGDGPVHLDSDLATPHLFFSACRWGYGWVFPNRDAIVVGIGGLYMKNRRDLPGQFEEFLNAIDLPAFADRRPTGSPLPFGNYIPSPVYGGALLVGDAGGFASPILGEGIFYAHRTAELAAHAANRHLTTGAPLARTYTTLLQRRLIPELKAEMALRNYLYGCLEGQMRIPLEVFMKAASSRVIDAVQGFRSFLGFRKVDDLHTAIW